MEYVADIETDGLKPTKIHCMVVNGKQVGSNFFNTMTEKDYLIGHNFVCYDIPVLERILNVTVRAKLVDTLALSWYLYPKRNKHGLEDWGVEFGIPKPKITDWEGLTPAEYLHRCKEDVKINTMLWAKQKKDLELIYGVDGYWHLIGYLTFKMDCMREQEAQGWTLDESECIGLWTKLEVLQIAAKDDLEAVMPPVEVWKKIKRPKKPYKKDGSLSAIGIKWETFCDANDVGFDTKDTIEYSDGTTKPPNAGAPLQVKDWLFGLGWSPMTFDYKPNIDADGKWGKMRAIPQVKDSDGLLCQSVERLIKDHPEVAHLRDLGVLGHRIGILKGFMRSVCDGKVVAGCQGLTNTLRFKHRTCVNIPSCRKPYGSDIRALLGSPDGYELVGADMDSLEDRTKQHYMWPHDPDYVRDMMTPDFDPHLDMGLVSGTMSELQCAQYRDDKSHSDLRHDNKQINYSATYGVSADGVVRNTGMAKKMATKLLAAFWDRNWSIKAIAEEQETQTIGDMTWMFNPVSKIWYWLKKDKDRFSTLNQGTGTYCFDMWVKELRKRGVRMVGQFHDEVISQVRIGFRDKVAKDFRDSVEQVNKDLGLNRELSVGVDFGKDYSEIH